MTEQTPEHEAAPVDKALSDSPADEGNTDTIDESPDDAQENEPETFPREYVQKLRDESAKHRQRAQRADDLAARLHTALVAATGRLADPTDLSVEESHLDDAEALTAAIDELLTRKPHLASRRVSGDVGQGASKSSEAVDLAGMLRARA